MSNKISWKSDPFFTFWKEYKMCLRVDATGHGSAGADHVSVSLVLMPGPYDDKLRKSGYWPLRGTFKIELLDQLDNNNHTHYIPFESNNIPFDSNVPFDSRDIHYYANIPMKVNVPFSRWGNPQFISHKTILAGNYLKDDSVYFMISYQS